MNVLLIGSGGREHALAWKLSQSRRLTKLYCAPGNPGTEEVAEGVPIPAGDARSLLGFALDRKIDLAVVGPEQPLALGIVDVFQSRQVPVFGPSRGAARLEWSKAFAKNFMERHGIPTARYRTFTRSDHAGARAFVSAEPGRIVLKADGLAAGKGVIICEDTSAALSMLEAMMNGRAFGDAGETIVVEEFLEGTEASIFAVSDGSDYVVLAPACDYKRALDGDRGKNTGGMGSYSPAVTVTPEILEVVNKRIVGPTLRGMAQEGQAFVGCLYVGLMLTAEGPKVVEYNCRFGDPETQVVLPLYNGDLLELLAAATSSSLGRLADTTGQSPSGAAVCVVLTSEGYPDSYPKGRVISGLEAARAMRGVLVFHAGTVRREGTIVTSGGRVLGVTALSPAGDIGAAAALAYEAAATISFEGKHYRRDIARAVSRSPIISQENT